MRLRVREREGERECVCVLPIDEKGMERRKSGGREGIRIGWK